MSQKVSLSYLKERWPSAIVSRSEISRFTGGAISSGTMANADAANRGVAERFKIGGKVCYPVDALIAWLESRAERLDR